jgi:hypothetical protein
MVRRMTAQARRVADPVSELEGDVRRVVSAQVDHPVIAESLRLAVAGAGWEHAGNRGHPMLKPGRAPTGRTSVISP